MVDQIQITDFINLFADRINGCQIKSCNWLYKIVTKLKNAFFLLNSHSENVKRLFECVNRKLTITD